MKTCNKCQKEIEWKRTKAGKWHPFNPGTLTSHFFTCGKVKTVPVERDVRARYHYELESGLRRNLGDQF